MNNAKHTVNNGKHTVNNGKHTVNNGKHSVNNAKHTVNNPIKEINGKYKCKKHACPKCKKLFKAKRYLTDHLKYSCKMNVCKMNNRFKNIYTYDINTFGKQKYGLKGGEIYIVQTDHNNNNHFKIGKTTNLYNRMRQYRIDSVTEPRLFYYYPFSNIHFIDNKLKQILCNYHINKNIFKCELDILRNKLTLLQEEHGDDKLECKPIIKDNCLKKCAYCEETFFCRTQVFDHWKECTHYIEAIKTNTLCKKSPKKTDSSFVELSEQIVKLKAEHAKEKHKMQREIENLLERVGNTNIENQTITININSYGKENLEYITGEYISKLFKIPYKAVPSLVKHIHFNPEHPENHNIKITNKKLPYATVYKDAKWEICDKKEIIEDIVDKSYNMIDCEFDDLHGNLSFNQKKRYKNFQIRYDNKEKLIQKQLNKDVELSILNHNND